MFIVLTVVIIISIIIISSAKKQVYFACRKNAHKFVCLFRKQTKKTQHNQITFNLPGEKNIKTRTNPRTWLPVFQYLKNNTDQTPSCPRDCSFSRHHGGPIHGPLKPPNHYSVYHFEGFRRALNWAPSCRRTLVSRTADASLSNLEYLAVKNYKKKPFKLVIAILLNWCITTRKN